jgi:hypothetical protein
MRLLRRKRYFSYFFLFTGILMLTFSPGQLNAQIRSLKLGVGPALSMNLLKPDDAKKKLTLGGGMDIIYSAFPYLGIESDFGYLELGGERTDYTFKTSVWQFKTNLVYNILPNSKVNPNISGGIGILYFDPKYDNGRPLPNASSGAYQKWSIVIPVGIGANIFFAEEFSLNFSAHWNFAMSDYLDDIKIGNGDSYMSFKIGFSYYFFDKFYILRERHNKL